jgi:ribosome-binding ATPase YchF (GTP1/OBG family)
VVTITDIAGLVKGASEGAGLGNAFLSHIQVRMFYVVRRTFRSSRELGCHSNLDGLANLAPDMWHVMYSSSKSLPFVGRLIERD